MCVFSHRLLFIGGGGGFTCFKVMFFGPKKGRFIYVFVTEFKLARHGYVGQVGCPLA